MQDYFAYLDEAQGATDLVTIREPRIGDGPVRPVQLTTQPRKRTGNAWLAAGVAAAAVLVLIGGWALLFATPATDAPVADTVSPTTLKESPSVRQSQWPGLTDDIPDGVESGTLTSPSSSARWVHLSGDEFTLPSQGPLEVNASGEFIVSDLPSYFWYSDGGIEWRLEESVNDHVPRVPDDTDQMTRYFDDSSSGEGAIAPWVPYADGSYGRYWIIASDPIEIWSSEGAFWTEEDLSGIVLPDSDGFTWDTEISPDYDGFTWDTEVSRPVTRYGNSDGVQSILHVWFAGPYLGVSQRYQTAERLLLLEDGGGTHSATMIEVPWVVTGEQPHDVALFGTSDSVYAYVRDWASNQTLVWRTDDGYDWTELNRLGAQLGIVTDEMFQIAVLDALQDPATGKPIRNQVVVATLSGQAWESIDGVNWTPAPEGYPAGTTPIRLESGWFATGDEQWWMYLGDTWVSLSDLGMESDGPGCLLAPKASGQTTIFFATSHCNPPYVAGGQTTDLWILSLNP